MVLAGISRRTLYNHCDSGRVTYTVGPDGRRYFETAELERGYGKLKTIAQSPAQQIAQTGTPSPNDLQQLIEAAVHRATAPLIEEIAALRETLMRIEHKPETPLVQQPKPPITKPVKSIADVLAFWE